MNGCVNEQMARVEKQTPFAHVDKLTPAMVIQARYQPE